MITPPRRRLVYVRQASDGRWLVHFGYPPCDVYDTWAEAIHAATALRRKPGILPTLPPRERRERVRDEYRHFRSLGLPHGVTCDRLATVYRLSPKTIDNHTRDLRDQPHAYAA